MTEASDAAEPAGTADVLQLPSAPQTRGRQWVRGQSGNPAGRPRRGYATSEQLRKALADELPLILERVVRAAQAGDIAACRLILDRCVPTIKPIELPVVMSPLPAALPEQGAALLTAMTNGQLSPEQCSKLLVGVGAVIRAAEVDALVNRVAAVEKLLEAHDAETRPHPR